MSAEAETVSHHILRRRARARERVLEQERIAALPRYPAAAKYHYRVAKRRGGMRWVVERVWRVTPTDG